MKKRKKIHCAVGSLQVTVVTPGPGWIAVTAVVILKIGGPCGGGKRGLEGLVG